MSKQFKEIKCTAEVSGYHLKDMIASVGRESFGKEWETLLGGIGTLTQNLRGLVAESTIPSSDGKESSRMNKLLESACRLPVLRFELR
jgi:hypothetical protein